jgi:hypothetical protein
VNAVCLSLLFASLDDGEREEKGEEEEKNKNKSNKIV